MLALSSGQLKCIGATTYTEYRGVFEKDHALSRRFQKIDVSEPSVEQTVQILRGLKSRFEEHHNVRYSAAALSAAARSEEHTSALQSLMRISYAVFHLKKKK